MRHPVPAKLHVCLRKAPCEGTFGNHCVCVVCFCETDRTRGRREHGRLNTLFYGLILVCGECICACDLLTAIPNNLAQMLSVCVRALVCVLHLPV